jgi:nitrite reductase (NADH) large subunit
MARVIATYECEWKRAVEDPETLKRFRHFINSDAGDENVKFVREREQKRPATRAERKTLAEEVG